MGRLIPLELARDTTTTCLLLRVEPVEPAFAPYGVTGLDRDVVSDDGRGALVYSAAVGVEPTALQSTANLAVDNAEATSLMPAFEVPIREEDIRAGVYDFARSPAAGRYEDLGAGHVTLQEGTLGQVSINDEGLSFVNELRGLAAGLKQSICQKDSLTCRAIFGSQPEGDSSGAPVEIFPCGVDATALLVAGTVTAVGLENTLTFTVSGFTMAADELNPGMVFWQTGLNAGKANEIDTNTAGGVITLAHETAWPIAIGDTLQYRVDCNKQARDTDKGCKADIRWGANWIRHFRGEPDIPIGDMGAMETPGASSGPGQGGYVSIPFPTEPE